LQPSSSNQQEPIVTEQKAFKDRLNWIQTSTDLPETVVLVHAVGRDLIYWDRQIEALHTQYNVVALDLPGHGLSPGDPRDWSFEYAAATIAELIGAVSAAPVHLWASPSAA
jgi:3-oxoadipate enol-lactonase